MPFELSIDNEVGEEEAHLMLNFGEAAKFIIKRVSLFPLHVLWNARVDVLHTLFTSYQYKENVRSEEKNLLPLPKSRIGRLIIKSGYGRSINRLGRSNNGICRRARRVVNIICRSCSCYN